ncbi:MAG: hypothetical protein IPQ15_00010 [Betaproteobacteria bacterium]|nr:hypothetical protein [Betaproteobacteria bacterium]
MLLFEGKISDGRCHRLARKQISAWSRRSFEFKGNRRRAKSSLSLNIHRRHLTFEQKQAIVGSNQQDLAKSDRVHREESEGRSQDCRQSVTRRRDVGKFPHALRRARIRSGFRSRRASRKTKKVPDEDKKEQIAARLAGLTAIRDRLLTEARGCKPSAIIPEDATCRLSCPSASPPFLRRRRQSADELKVPDPADFTLLLVFCPSRTSQNAATGFDADNGNAQIAIQAKKLDKL